MLAQAQRHGAQAPQAQEDVFRTGTHGESVVGGAQRLEAALVGRDHAEQKVGAAAEILRAGLDGDVDAAFVRREEQGGRPGIIHQDHAPCRCATSAMAGMSCISSDCDPGASVNTAVGVRADQSFDPGADRRIVIGGFHTKSLQHPVTEVTRRADRPNRSPAGGRRT